MEAIADLPTDADHLFSAASVLAESVLEMAEHAAALRQNLETAKHHPSHDVKLSSMHDFVLLVGFHAIMIVFCHD